MIDVPVRVKDALRDGRLKKNYRFVVLNDDGSADFTIDNNTLVSESVKFDERMCSGDTLKFGLCEGSSLEFQYFDHPNINGRRIQSFIDVEYKETSIEIKETEEGVWHPTKVTKNGTYTFKSKSNVTCVIGIGEGTHNQYYELNTANNYTKTLHLTTRNDFWVEDVNITVVVTSETGFPAWHPIPMGFFEVDKCPRQASTGIFKVTAYNKLKSQYLDAKANDKIIEIVSEGVVGGTDGADIGTILDQLLEGYSIKREEETVDFIVTRQQIPSSDTSTIRETVLDGSYNGFYIHSLDITDYLEPVSFNPTNFYRFRINFKNIFDAIYSYAGTDFIDEWFKSTTTSGQIARLYSWLRGTTSFNSYLSVGGFQFNTSNGSVAYSLQEYRNVNDFTTPWFTNITSMMLGITGLYAYDMNATRTWTQAEIDLTNERINELLFDQGNFKIEISSRSNIEKLIIGPTEAESLPDVTLRQLQSAVFEVNAQYGQIDRVTDLFEGVELNHSRLYPANSLYPANNLYPGGQGIRGDRSTYSKLWTDYQGIQKFRYLIITYKGLDEEDKTKDMTLQRTINASGNVDYVMSDNWLFKNLIWNATQVGAYADAMVSKLRDVTWFPFEMWCAGLPYLETGDEIEITNDEGTYPSYILQRQLQGIQNLQDTFINGTLDVF